MTEFVTLVPEHGCEGKVRFADMAEALAVQTRKKRRCKGTKRARQPYRCKACRGVHLGTPWKRNRPHAEPPEIEMDDV
jgi:hypothetical protein